MYLNSILRWALQYQLLLALIIAGVHMFHMGCAPYKELYDIATLLCNNCLTWHKYLKKYKWHGISW